MNPYLEHRRVFHDFHQSFIVTARRHLQRQVKSPYAVQVDYDVYLHEPTADVRLTIRPDVWVAKRPGPAVLDAPSISPRVRAPRTGELELPDISEVRSNLLRVVNVDNDRLVAVVELLSPTNKSRPDDRAAYLKKRNGLLLSDAHFVEIDLLRAGPRMPVRGLGECDYYAMVSRSDSRPAVELWPIQLREPLPTVPVPLEGTASDVLLDVQAVLNDTFDESGYAQFIYRSDPEPPLSADDLAWAKSLVA